MSSKEAQGSKVALKKFHVFRDPVKIKPSKDDGSQQLINQLKKFNAVYIDPYVVIGDLGTKLIFVLKPGERYVIFRAFENETLYLYGTQFKTCPLAVIGKDFDGQHDVLKLKFYAYTELFKVLSRRLRNRV
jgi:hypothetical protein